MTWVKICGITNVEDALIAAVSGADAVGLVFAESPRRVSVETAREIAAALPVGVMKVGVFVDAAAREIEDIVSSAGLDAAQLHGVETARDCVALSMPVIKRIAVTVGDTAEAVAARSREFEVWGMLLDPGSGSGRAFDWGLAKSVSGRVIVAGGLNAGNVEAVIRKVRPFGVDVSSGVEARAGRKESEKVRAFVRHAKEAGMGRDG